MYDLGKCSELGLGSVQYLTLEVFSIGLRKCSVLDLESVHITLSSGSNCPQKTHVFIKKKIPKGTFVYLYNYNTQSLTTETKTETKTALIDIVL